MITNFSTTLAQIEIRHLRYFMAVAQHLHFRKAAASLFISQPGLSRQIKDLEATLGAALFERDTRQVRLTAAGVFYRKEVGFLLQELERSSIQVKQVAAGLLAEIKIGFLGSAMQTVIPEMLVQLKLQFSTIKTSLEELSNLAQIKGVIEQRLDIGFVRVQQVSDSLGIHSVHEDSFSLVVPKDHFLNEENFTSLRQCMESPFILFDPAYSPPYFNTIMSLFEQAGFSPKQSHKSVHAQTIFTLVAQNLGLAIVPASLQKGFDMGVRFIALDQLEQRAILSVIWNKQSRNKALVHCLEVLGVPLDKINIL